MRPLSLEMTAFGSYAETTVLPFEDLKHGLYLVTGDTGAGKTTIFDAIMFALFGVASGADRKTDMLHCDYVPKSTDTVVKLRFSQNGKEYTVERKIHFSKVRGTTDQYGDGQISALLDEPDAARIEGAKKVTERCEELLGLNAEQFSRIIMLAQGEFKRFLKANSDEKNDILGKLFDNSVYVYYQNLLLQARDALGKRRSAGTAELRSLMEVSFVRPVSFHGEEGEAFLPGHPALIENLERLTAEETEALDRQRAERDAAFERLGELSRRQGEARAVNALLEELAQGRARLLELEARDEEMQQRQALLDRRDAALHSALPAVRQAEKAEEERKRTLAEIEELRSDLETESLAVSEAEAAVRADERAAQEKREIENRIHSLEEQLPRYAELRAREDEKQRAAQALLETGEKRAAEDERLARLQEAFAAQQKRLEALNGADAALAACQNEEKQAAERLEALAGKTGLAREISAIGEQEAALGTEQEKLLRLMKEAGEASAYANALYQKFIAAQAAVLADELRQSLTEREEALCPVCGTRLHRHQLPQLAQLAEETPDKDKMDRAREARERAESARGEQYAAVQSQSAALTARKQAAAERAAQLLPGCGNWKILTAEGVLDAAIEEARQNAERCKAALSQAERNKTERDALRRQLPQQEQEQRTVQEQAEALREQERTYRGAIAAAEAAIAVLRTQLQQDESAAQQEKETLETRAAAIAQQIQAHQERWTEAKSRRDTILGSLREKENAAEKLTSARNAALNERDRRLEETGFASAEEVLAVLEPLGQRDAEVWIRAERTALSEHEISKNSTRELIEMRLAQTEGKQTVDLTALEAEKQQLSEQHARLNEICTAQENLLSNHRAVLEKASGIRKDLAESDRAWKRLDALASLAGGVNSESGKLSFDRYVMGTMFREILEMANRRMELMSGGRYELVHKVGAERRNAKAGLEIEVLDKDTGLQRSSGTLSGGEGFFTSLALALGLSDVVQNHAGGKAMDALFIDEGFGTLSDDVLDKALDVLNQLTEGNRLVGIISHVDKLDESIPQKVRVRRGEKGSTLSLELA